MIKSKKLIIIITGTLIALSIIFKTSGISPLIKDGLLIASTLMGLFPIARNALRSLKYKVLGIEALVTIAVIGAMFIGEYFEGAAVTFLFTFGAFLETKTLEKTRSSLKALLEMAPETATVIRGGQEITVSPEEIVKGETIMVKPGERIPADGEVMEGLASVNQAMITGESIPVEKKIGDPVYSGTVIENGYLKLKAERVGEDTTFARIMGMVEEAQEAKAPSQKFIERFSKYYTPGIFLLSLFVFLFTFDVELALTLLVISCPGAMVISIPVAIVAGIGNGAKNGILIKGGEYIEKLSKMKALAMDKTGTLTRGLPSVARVRPYGRTEREVILLASAVEKNSEHHLAKAIIGDASARLLDDIPAVSGFEAYPGYGVKGSVNGASVLVGTITFMKLNNIFLLPEIETDIRQEEARGRTVVVVSENKKIIGLVSISDKIREDAYHFVSGLKKAGVKRVVMLTGDNYLAAKDVAERLGIHEFYAGLLPDEKVKKVKDLKNNAIIGMIGDGVNDAPALATADIGIAMGISGTDATMETADMVLMTDSLHKLLYALRLSKKTARIMKENLYFSIGVVFLLIIGVLLKGILMAAGMLVHEISVLLVIMNAVRLLYLKEEMK
jgi:Cd2+/Zn2+-exporting ATPase